MRKLVVFVVIALVAGLAMALPLLQRPREMVDYAPSCDLCLRQVVLALHQYHDHHGTLPELITRDEDGKPMHSWRVAVLPYLDANEVYDAYNFSKPWDSDENLAVGESAPKYFRCWKCQGPSNTTTNILAVAGPDTCWPAKGAVNLNDIKDGPRETIQLISLPETGIHWLQPADYSVGDSLPPSRHGDGHPVAFADGSVGLLPGALSLRPFSTIATGDLADRHAIVAVPR